MKLTAAHLSFSYGYKPVLRDISLTLDQGQILCVLGPNGTGKSTLFRCLLGLQHGYSGKIFLDGEDICALSPRSLARCIAYIPQFTAPIFPYSVFHSVLMGTSPHLKGLSSPGTIQEASALRALERLDILSLKDRTVRSLSGGERQLVLIARALAQDAPLLVMDEPTASLDYGNAVRVMAIVEQLSHQGYGILLSSHDPNQVLRYGTHALVINKGKIQSFGPPLHALTPELLSDIYGIPVQIAVLPVNGILQRICIPAGQI